MPGTSSEIPAGVQTSQNDLSVPVPFGLPHLQRVMASIHHAESVVQTRLYNFLVANSILLLSWVTIFTTPDRPLRSVLLVGASAVSFLFSLLFLAAGERQRRRIQFWNSEAEQTEARLDIPEWARYGRRLANQSFPWWLRWASVQVGFVAVPGLFTLAAAVLIAVSTIA